MPIPYLPDVAITLRATTCYLCGIPFAMPADLIKQRIEDRGKFWCPNGHDQHFLGETEAQALAKQLKAKADELSREKHWREQADARVKDLSRDVARERNRVNGYKGAMARTKRRVANGRCPCCSEQFKNRESHMQTRHPNWNPDKHADAIAEKAG